LSHRSAAALWGIRREAGGPIDVVVPDHVCRRRPGIRVHRRARLVGRTVDDIPVTDPVSTLVDLAMCTSNAELEEAVNGADHRNLIDPETLRAAIESIPERAGVGRLRRLLDPRTFVVTESRLEQRFLPLARAVGLPLPQTQVWLNGYRVDFFWPDLGLIVEADSLRYHRTAAKQTADLRRDQAHTAAGLSTLRFTHWEVFYEPDHVRETLATTFRWIAGRAIHR
jgi:very-short-patch-repair endonuclease